jgi:NADH:ubiquinone oxidoreductase subunit E
MPLSSATEAAIEVEVAKYPKRRSGLLPALKLAQAETHLLTPPVIARVADLVGVSHAAANELATFYSMLHTEPHGKTIVEVCVQLPCALRGADELLERLSSELRLEPGQTSENGALTLIRTHECFGACHRAPMCLVNGEYREHLRGEQLEGFISELRAALAA